MSSPEPLSARLLNYLIAECPAREPLTVQEASRALHEEFLRAEGGSLPDRQGRLEQIRAVGVRAWLRHVAAVLQTEWPAAPRGMQGKLELRVARGGDRREALELEEQAALEREGISGDSDADHRRVTLRSYVGLFAEGVGEIASPEGRSGPALGRQITAIMRREAPRRRAVENASLEAWAGSPVEGVLEDAPTTAAPPEADIVRMVAAAGVRSDIRTLCIVLGEALGSAGEGFAAG